MSDPSASPRPPTLVGAGVLLGVEGLFLLVMAALELASLHGGRVTLAVTTALFFAVLAAGLLLCAWGLLRARSWARSPAVAAQLIGLLLAFSFWGGETTPVAVALLLVSAAVLAGVLHPASTRALAAPEDGR